MNKVADRNIDMNIAVLAPTIDKLSYGFSPNAAFLKHFAPEHNLEEYKKHIKTTLLDDAFNNPEGSGISHVTGVPFMKKPWSSYKVNLWYKPPSSDESIFLQVDPKTGGKLAYMRLDMNPNRFSKKAIEEFREFIEGLLLIPGATITFNDFLNWSSIYRADIAVDILGARPSDLEIRLVKDNTPFPHKSHVWKSKTGRAETVYPKAKKGESSIEYFYDKRQEFLDKGLEPLYGDFLHTRFECRVHKTTFQKLLKIQNRCNRFSVKALHYGKYGKLHYKYHLFIRHALTRTLEKALELIPIKYKPKFASMYNETMTSIWRPKKIWAYWPDAIKTSGLFFTNG